MIHSSQNRSRASVTRFLPFSEMMFFYKADFSGSSCFLIMKSKSAASSLSSSVWIKLRVLSVPEPAYYRKRGKTRCNKRFAQLVHCTFSHGRSNDIDGVSFGVLKCQHVSMDNELCYYSITCTLTAHVGYSFWKFEWSHSGLLGSIHMRTVRLLDVSESFCPQGEGR